MMRRAECFGLAAIACIGLSTAIGCGELTAEVSGVVYLDGQRLKVTNDQRGMVVFRPVAGGATCTGLIKADGSYKLATGSTAMLAPGDYLVSVRVMELVAAEGNNEAPSGRPVTPPVYGDPLTSGLTCMVKSGANTYDVKIKSVAPLVPLDDENPANEAPTELGDAVEDQTADREPEAAPNDDVTEPSGSDEEEEAPGDSKNLPAQTNEKGEGDEE